ncbi:M4 family metallopeptidase [Streptomyces sp. NPDC001941]|uniref:M4 family metallopeptidase n=1 Tax=Streptomyces sp. NPDC001941 TaxID=3154659 RepID=UPI0033257C94
MAHRSTGIIRPGVGTARRGTALGATALLGAVALVVSVPPASAAQPGPAPAAPGEVLPGRSTETPALVDGIREAAPAAPDATGAARAYLKGKRERYRIADPARDLAPLSTSTGAGGQETVRLQQRHRGVPVLGGQYVVRMENRGGARVVTGTSGAYFTGLTTGTTAAVDESLAVERAVDAVTGQLNDGRPVLTESGEPPVTGTSRGLVVLPTGSGVLALRVTVRGSDPSTGEPVLREVYVDANAGFPVLQYSGIKTFGNARPSTARTAPGTAKSSKPAAKPAKSAAKSARASGVAKGADEGPGYRGSGIRLDGQEVPLELGKVLVPSEAYTMHDVTRIHTDEGNSLSTFDARGLDVSDVSGKWPDTGIEEFSSPTPEFGAEATAAGAVDAHWGAGRVYDYYWDKHGRDSLDGHGMTINSLVGVTQFGQGYVNAFWDGQKMVYGSGDAEYKPLSAGLDVIGHEMTHGVVETSANLVYAGQSGAMNEALADYFGNAIENAAHGVATADPDSGLVGERLCRTLAPRDCALRDLNDGRTTAGSYIGAGFGTDNGGVHLNSTIFSGALWDAREDLGDDFTDKAVYRALTQYLTPLDGFTQGRAAVLAAAKDLGATTKQLNVLKRDFNAHGIAPGWELALGVDSDVVQKRVNTFDSKLGAGGGWWAAAKSNESGDEPYSVWAGRLDGKGQVKLMSPNDGRYHVNPATDGKTVVWQAWGSTGVDVLSRPLAGGPVKKLFSSRSGGSTVDVDGDTVTFDYANYGGRRAIAYLSVKDPQKVVSVGGGTYHRAFFPSVSNGKVSYQDTARVRAAEYAYTTRVADVATGEDRTVQRVDSGVSTGPTAITGRYVFWLVDEVDGNGATALRRANLDGTGIVDLSPETGAGALNLSALTASEDAVTAVALQADTVYRNETLPKLWQFTADGAPGAAAKGRVSCNRGEQSDPAAAAGSQVIWLDGTTGVSDIVTRTRPAGRCG